MRYAIIKHRPRNTLDGKFAPDTVPLQDRPFGDDKGHTIPVLRSAWEYMEKINDAGGYSYARSVGAMWINIPYDSDTPYSKANAESISCGGNFVSFDYTLATHGHVRAFPYTQDFSIFNKWDVNWLTRPDLFFKAVAINSDGKLIKVGNGLDVYIPVMSYYDLFLRLEDVELFPQLPIIVTVTASPYLRTRSYPSLEGQVTNRYWYGQKAIVTDYRPRGASVWGKTDKGWICLLQADVPGQRNFHTTWKLQTVGVIPP